MSQRNSGEVQLRKVDTNRRSGVVKSLILEFEQLQTFCSDQPSGLLNMGAEQSTSAKYQNRVSSPLTSPKNFVKQRVSQFNVENDSLSDKRKRHKSTSDNNKSQYSITKDFLRSISADPDRREKDRYSRTRQVTPKARDSDKLGNPNRRNVTDSNNNSKENNLKINPDNLKKTSHQKDENLANIKTTRSLAQRFHFPEDTHSAAEKKSKGKSTNDNINRKEAANEIPLINSRYSSKKKIRSVKSIRKVFENSDSKPPSAVSGKTPRKNILSDSDTAKVDTDKAANQNGVGSNTCKGKQTCETIELGNNIIIADHVNILPSEISQIEKSDVENYRKDIVNNIANEFYLIKSIVEEDNYSEDEFNEIEQNLQEMQETIKELEKHQTNATTEDTQSDVLSGASKENGDFNNEELLDMENKDLEKGETLTIYLEQPTFDDQEEMQETITELEKHKTYAPTEDTQSDVLEGASKENGHFNNEELLDTENKDLEKAETLTIYLEQPTFDDQEEDEFGKRSFGSSDNISYTEAYNKDGNVLIVTTVAAVEHRSISREFTSAESLVSAAEDNIADVLNSSAESMANHVITILSKNSPAKQIEGTEDSHDIKHSLNERKILNEIQYPETSKVDDNAAENSLLEQDSESASNRSTIYSNTNTNSTDSLNSTCKTASEEGTDSDKYDDHIFEQIKDIENHVEIRNNSSNGQDRAIRTETYYDTFKNPRIAKVTNINSGEYLPKTKIPSTEEAEPREQPRSPTTNLKPKKDYLIEELIDTERKYIKHLEKVVWDYIPALTDEKLPPLLIGKSRYLFGNVKKIYGATQKFYKALKRCGNDHEEIAKTFLNFKNLFELYPLYSKNKPVADQYLSGDFKDVVVVREKELNDRLGLASNLLTPIQRLGKYILFLEQIQKEVEKVEGVVSDNIYKAIQTVRKQMSRGNDYIAIDSIKNSPISLLEQGSFLIREKFNVIKPRKYEAMMFLFEEILVFTTVDPRNPEMFIYRESIKLNEMGIVTFDEESPVFHLKRFPSYKKGPKEHNEFVIEAKKNKDKKIWTERIEKLLWEQLVKCKEEQKELHNNQGKRNSIVELPDRSRQKKAGYSSLPNEMRKKPPKSIFYYKVPRDA